MDSCSSWNEFSASFAKHGLQTLGTSIVLFEHHKKDTWN